MYRTTGGLITSYLIYSSVLHMQEQKYFCLCAQDLWPSNYNLKNFVLCNSDQHMQYGNNALVASYFVYL